MTTRIFEPRQSGPITVDLAGYNSHIEATSEPGITRARIELITDATSGPTIDMLDALGADDEGDYFTLHLPKSEGRGSVSVSGNLVGGSYVVSSGDITMTSGGMISSMSGISGDADMVVNGQRIQVRGGRTYVNGIAVDGGASGAATDPPMPVRFRAVLPEGSSLIADSYNGNVLSRGVGKVRIKTYNGDVRLLDEDMRARPQTRNGRVRYPS